MIVLFPGLIGQNRKALAMNRKLIIGIAAGLVAVLVCGFAAYEIFFVKRGLVKTDEGTYYYSLTGEPITGMQTMENKAVRYFDPDTRLMATGETQIEGSNYLFDGDGVMMYGRQQVNNAYKYFDPKTGKMLTGWIETPDGKYYSDKDGVSASGLTTVEGKDYFFDKKTGLMVKGLVTDGSETYCFDESTGVAVDGIVEGQDGTKRGFIGGKMLKDCRAYDNNHLYYFDGEGNVCREIDGTKKMVALTYDDGPSVYTDAILDVFVEYNQKATFFVVGDRISWNEDQAKREAELGFQQGNHTYNHNVLTKLSEEKIKEKLKGTDDELVRISGKSSVYLRPPEGRYNDTLKKACGCPIILWSVDSRDWESKDCDKVCNQIIGKVKDGDIVLMHDLYKSTAEATKKIVPALVKEGFQLVTVEEMAILKTDGKGLENGVVYTRISGNK